MGDTNKTEYLMLITGLLFRFSEYFIWISWEIISAIESLIAKGQRDRNWCPVPRDMIIAAKMLNFVWFSNLV